MIYWIASIYFFEQVLSTHMLILLFILYKWTSSQREIHVFVATKVLETFSKNSRTQLSWSAVLWTIFYFIMHVIKINNFFTSSFAFLKINGMKKMWIMYLLSAFLKKIFSMKVCCYPSLAFVFIKVGPNWQYTIMYLSDKANLKRNFLDSKTHSSKHINMQLTLSSLLIHINMIDQTATSTCIFLLNCVNL